MSRAAQAVRQLLRPVALEDQREQIREEIQAHDRLASHQRQGSDRAEDGVAHALAGIHGAVGPIEQNVRPIKRQQRRHAA